MIDLTQIIVAVIGLLAAVVTAVAIPWIKTKIGAQRWAQLEAIACMAVQAAQQMGATDVVTDKLAYATAQTKASLAKAGITYDDGIIRAAIEAAVLQLNQD